MWRSFSGSTTADGVFRGLMDGDLNCCRALYTCGRSETMTKYLHFVLVAKSNLSRMATEASISYEQNYQKKSQDTRATELTRVNVNINSPMMPSQKMTDITSYMLVALIGRCAETLRIGGVPGLMD